MTKRKKMKLLPKPRSFNWLLYQYIKNDQSASLSARVGAAIVISTHNVGDPTRVLSDSVHRNGATWQISLSYQYIKRSSA